MRLLAQFNVGLSFVSSSAVITKIKHSATVTVSTLFHMHKYMLTNVNTKKIKGLIFSKLSSWQ